MFLSDQRSSLQGDVGARLLLRSQILFFQVVFSLDEVSALFSERETKDDDSFRDDLSYMRGSVKRFEFI